MEVWSRSSDAVAGSYHPGRCEAAWAELDSRCSNHSNDKEIQQSHRIHKKHLPSSPKWDLNWLVVLTILKNMKVNGKDYPIYYGK